MQTIVNLGTGGADLNGQNGSTTSADSNDALSLDWAGENYVYTSGGTFNYLSVPDEAALDITGDIDVRMRVAPDTWSDTSFLPFLAKATTTGSQQSWKLWASSGTPYLRFTHSPNGSTTKSAVSTVAIPFSDGDEGWIRATLDVDNGSGGHDVKFYTSTDGVTWTQLGSTVTTAGVTSVYSGTAPVTAMYHVGQASSKSGKIYRAQVLDGIDGTPVLDVDCSQITSGADTSFTALTGQAVTINRSTSGRKAVAVVSPVWLFGTDDYMEVADNALLDFGASESLTVVAAHRVWNTQGTNDTLVAKKSNTTNTTQGWSLSGGSSTALAGQAQIGDGSAGITATSSNRVAGQLTVLAAVRDVAADTLTVFRNGLAGSAVTDTTTSSLSNAEVLRIARLSGAGMEYADMELVGVAVLRRALSPTEVAQVTAYYQARLS